MRVAHNGGLWLLGHLKNFFEMTWNVIVAHVCPSEVPVLFEGPRCVVTVNISILVASVGANPDVITKFSELSWKTPSNLVAKGSIHQKQR